MNTRTPDNYHRWSRVELDALAEHWPHGGFDAVSPHLPGISPNAARGKASALGLRVAGRKRNERQPTSELIDAAVRRGYRDGRPNLRELERATGRHSGWLKWRAAALGVATGAKRRNPPWSAEEDAAVENGLEGGLSAVAIHAAMRRAGSERSLSAIAIRVCHLGLSWNREWWTATDVARMFGVDQSGVVRWIGRGMLAATREHGPSNAVGAGKTYWKILPEAVTAFLLEHPEQWDHRRMRKEVLLDLLAPNRFNHLAKKEASR